MIDEPDELPPDTVKVYGLYAGQSKKCRYVGQTRNHLKVRLAGHYTDARKRTTSKLKVLKWIRECISRKVKIQIRLLKDDAIWDVDEIRMIKKMDDDGHPLLNGTAGGELCKNIRRERLDALLEHYGLREDEIAARLHSVSTRVVSPTASCNNQIALSRELERLRQRY